MSITDELREYSKTTSFPAIFKELTDIADRIDEQYAKARDKAYDEGVCDGIDADKNAMCYIKGPVDADGVPWHLGDKVDGMDGEITYLRLGYIGWAFSVGDPYTFRCEKYRHVKPDTWERIIQDAVKLGYADYPTTCYEAELVERCKKLAGEAK